MDVTTATSSLSSLLPDLGSAASSRLTLKLRRDDADTAGTSTGTVGNDDAASFAEAIMSRIESALASNANAATGQAASDLEKALTDTVVFARDNFGNAAAQTVMGLIAKGVGDGQGGEDAMGNALLSSLRFIDSTFGVAAGDKAMANFNGALNQAVNAYFQNGHDEVFYAADATTTGASQLSASLASALSAVADRHGQDAATMIADIMDASLSETGQTREGLSTALTAASDALATRYGSDLDLGSGLTLTSSLGRGSVLDVTV